MAKDSELNMTLKYITGIDISFVIDDIIRDFVDPNIPVNIDENFSIDVDTPYGICNIATKYVEDHYEGDHYEVIFKRFISETYYEEYKLNLNYRCVNFPYLSGRTVELRKKGFIITDICKYYAFDEKEKKITDINQIYKGQFVYFYEKLRQKRKILEIFENFENIISVNKETRPIGIILQYTNCLVISNPSWLGYENINRPIVFINEKDWTGKYPMYAGTNIVGRAFDLYEGIITNENYEDAIRLIQFGHFPDSFAYEDAKVLEDGRKSLNSCINSLIGPGLGNYKREYTAEVRDIINSYYEIYPNISKIRNEYIKEIILNKHGKSYIKEGDKNGKR